MKIAMIGAGYVGLVSGACFSDFGHHVICVDKDQGKIDALLGGKMPIFEPGLDQLVATNVAAGRLAFTTEIGEAVKDADAVFIAVGTPSRRGDGHADLSYVYAAAKEIGEALDHDCVVVTKSTVPVGTDPDGLAVSPDGTVVYVANASNRRPPASGIGRSRRTSRQTTTLGSTCEGDRREPMAGSCRNLGGSACAGCLGDA